MIRLTPSSRLRRPLVTLFVAAAAWLALLTLRPDPPPTVRVLAAARDLPAGATLAPSDVRPVPFPADAVPSGAIRSSATGRVLAGPMRRGEPLTDVRVIGARLLRGHGPGKVATPVRVADADTVRLLRPGDRIDVLAAPPATSPGEPMIPLPSGGTSQSGRPTGTITSPGKPIAAPPTEETTESGRPAGMTTPPGDARTTPTDEEAPQSRRPTATTTSPGEAGRAPLAGGAVDGGRPVADGEGGRWAGHPTTLAGRGTWEGARVVVSGVPVIAVPASDEESDEEHTRDGALIVLATDRAQALALAGTRTDLSVTIAPS